jgi:hypothetical protein
MKLEVDLDNDELDILYHLLANAIDASTGAEQEALKLIYNGFTKAQCEEDIEIVFGRF